MNHVTSIWKRDILRSALRKWVAGVALAAVGLTMMAPTTAAAADEGASSEVGILQCYSSGAKFATKSACEQSPLVEDCRHDRGGYACVMDGDEPGKWLLVCCD